MEKNYITAFKTFDSADAKTVNNISHLKCKPIFIILAMMCAFIIFSPSSVFSQAPEFAYSYVNITRNNGGGTLEQGDTIEVHIQIKFNNTLDNIYYMDTIPAGTQYVSNSMKLITNEGLLFPGSGPYTDASKDDAAVYISSGIPRLRINIGYGSSAANSGVAFKSSLGGGTMVNGSSRPLVAGNTLYLVAYRLVVTASSGSTIYPTGTYRYQLNGATTTVPLEYGGIKVVDNQALCNNFSSASFTAESSFGSGSNQNRAAPAVVPGYTKVNMGANAPSDNYYAIANNTSANGTTNNAGPFKPSSNSNRVFGGYWDIVGDHTGASNPQAGNLPTATGKAGGYMLVVNAAYKTGEVYRDTIKNVCPNTYYEFSAWVRNICGVCGSDLDGTQTYTPGVLPNLSFTVNDEDYYTTGNILHDNNWQKRGFIYKTGPAETQFRITIKNNAPGGGGDDWVIDDIKLATCYPDLVNSPKDTASACAGAPVILSDTVKSYFDNYTNFCWEKSADGVNWNSTGVCGSRVPTLNNGLWTYVIDTSFTTVAADSGTYYRLKVGTSAMNLLNSNCSVANSQKIFMQVYKVNCKLLEGQILNFTGGIIKDKSLLRWTSENERNVKTYEVEKSFDGIHFFQTGIVAAINDMDGANYSFVDPDPVSSVVFYRLRLRSASNDQNKYSKIIALYNKTASLKVTALNPFKNNVKLNIFLPEDGEVFLTLYDIFGKIVTRKNVQLSKGTSEVIIDDVERLPAGIYILRTQFNNQTTQNRLFKVN